MKKTTAFTAIVLAATVLLPACKSKIKQQEDELYSRHLQRHVKLSIINTPVPDDKSEMNLLLFNDAQQMNQLEMKEIIDSLYRKRLIKPLIVVGIYGNEKDEYGVSGYKAYQNQGDKADHYSAFIDDELYPFAKKKAGVRKFSSVVISGCTMGGLSAFDIAWDNADKINKVGVFSGSFGVTDIAKETPGYNDSTDRIILNKIKASRKRPDLQFWFYGDDATETGVRYHDSITINHTEDLIKLIKTKPIIATEIIHKKAVTGGDNAAYWRIELPAFLVWAFGKS